MTATRKEAAAVKTGAQRASVHSSKGNNRASGTIVGQDPATGDWPNRYSATPARARARRAPSIHSTGDGPRAEQRCERDEERRHRDDTDDSPATVAPATAMATK